MRDAQKVRARTTERRREREREKSLAAMKSRYENIVGGEERVLAGNLISPMRDGVGAAMFFFNFFIYFFLNFICSFFPR